MIKFSAIFIVTLLTLNIVGSMKLSPYSSIVPASSLKIQLQSLLVQVKQTENPKTIKGFITQIQQLILKLEEDQVAHQKVSEEMKDQCLKEEQFRAKEVADAQDALNRANKARTDCDNSLKASEKNLPELEKALADYQASLAAATLQREAENKAYQKRRNDYQEGINFVNDFFEYVKQKLNGQFTAFSFVEKSEHLLRHASRLGRMNDVVPILVALASQEIPSANSYKYTPNEDAAQKLKLALEELLNNLKTDFQANEEEEQKLLKAFEELRTRLEAAIASLTTNIAVTKEQIIKMTACVATEDAVIASAQAKLNRNSQLKDSASKMCADFAREFVHAFNSRVEEIKMVREVLEIIHKRFKNVPEDLKIYLESVEKKWRDYSNSTPFQAYVAYMQQTIEDNKSGNDLVNNQKIAFF